MEDAAQAAFDQAFPNEEERNNALVALIMLDRARNVDEQLAALWQALGTSQSPAMLKLAIEAETKPASE